MPLIYVSAYEVEVIALGIVIHLATVSNVERLVIEVDSLSLFHTISNGHEVEWFVSY